MERLSPRRLLIAAAVALVSIWTLILVIAPWDSARSAQEPIVSVPPAGGVEPVLSVDVTIEAVDAVKEVMRVRVLTTVLDPDAAGRDWIMFALLPNKQIIRPGQELVPVPVIDEMTMSGGGIGDYPWDGYLTLLLFAAGHENKEDPLETETDLPIRLNVYRTAYGFGFGATDLQSLPGVSEVDTGDSGIDLRVEGSATGVLLDIERGDAARGWAQVVIALYWLVAAGVAVVAIAVVTRWRAFETSRQLSWMSATMFALVAFRNALPGSPPIGVFFDWVAYFWAVGIVAASLVALIAFGLLDRSLDLRTVRTREPRAAKVKAKS